MASAVEICSNALLELGDNPINSFDEATQPGALDRAKLCANTYPFIRDWMLRAHSWNCATKRVVLAPDATPPAFDWSQRFLLPGDWLRTLSVGRTGQPDDYEIEGRYILADVSACYLRYIYRNEVVESWDVMFIRGMILAMKVTCAYAITKSTTKEEACKEELVAFLKQARAVDGQESPPETLGDFPFLQVRSADRFG